MRYKRRYAVCPIAAFQPPMTAVDLDRVARIIREVAEAEILPRFGRLADHDAWEKRAGSVVTVADQAAEERLEEALLALAPGSVALGEEAAEQDPAIFERLLDDDPVWIIDPVDPELIWRIKKSLQRRFANFTDGFLDNNIPIHTLLSGTDILTIFQSNNA